MLRHSTNLTRNGLTDWLMQRGSAVLLAAYTVFMLVYFLAVKEVSYQYWVALFSDTWFKIFTLLTILSVIVHAWIGMWTVFTDYIKPLGIRVLLTILLFVLLFSYFFVAVSAVWGL